MPDPRPILELVHRRWSIPVLSLLAAEGGAKSARLVHGLDVSPAVLRATLEDLEAAGWIGPNPGYGHPMRPEWVLTPAGVPVGRAARTVERAVNAADAADVAYRKWTLPVVWSVGRGVDRFGALEAGLPGMTARALTLALKALHGRGFVARTILETFPPSPRYALRPSGTALYRATASLARAAGT